jgi:hypothetical protein
MLHKGAGAFVIKLQQSRLAIFVDGARQVLPSLGVWRTSIVYYISIVLVCGSCLQVVLLVRKERPATYNLRMLVFGCRSLLFCALYRACGALLK